ncbi:MAG: Crp/Fnr family transcriptional regulator [Bacteroidetes bacterium]|nr:Crp/Fnr family transcriptional regulator [Bacteroidota bacterium]
MKLFEYIKANSGLKDEYHQDIHKVFKPETYKKGTILIKPDNRSQKVIFVESGLLRMYYQVEDKVITFLFLAENAMIFPLESVFYNKQDPYGWEVLQDCQIQSCHFGEIQKLIDTIPRFERFVLHQSFNVLKQMSDKLYSIQMLSAEERYKRLLETHPNILQNAPLGHIASYLGISQQHLSVIRAKKN